MGRLRTLAVGVALLSVAANAVLLVRRVRAEAHRVTATEAEAEPELGAHPQNGDDDGVRALETCRAELATIAGDARRLTQRLSRNAPPPSLFRLNAPNPNAEAALAPRLARMFQPGVGPGPVREHHLECRGLLCKLTFVAADSVDADAWRAFLRESDEVRGRVRVVRMEPPFPAFDPASQGDGGLSEWHVFLHLKSADGGRREQ
jgi:hypothetical protein